MNELSQQQCNVLNGRLTALSGEEIAELLPQLAPQWQLNSADRSISYRYTFNNYYQTMAFVNVVAQVAHQQDHHPELLVSYNSCRVSYSTHEVNGLSLKDFICAAKINNAQSL